MLLFYSFQPVFNRSLPLVAFFFFFFHLIWQARSAASDWLVGTHGRDSGGEILHISLPSDVKRFSQKVIVFNRIGRRTQGCTHTHGRRVQQCIKYSLFLRRVSVVLVRRAYYVLSPDSKMCRKCLIRFASTLITAHATTEFFFFFFSRAPHLE